MLNLNFVPLAVAACTAAASFVLGSAWGQKRAVKRFSREMSRRFHDIRSPLTAILGHIELLRSGRVCQEQADKSMQAIGWQGKNLTNQFESIVKLALGQSLIGGDRQAVDICQALTEACAHRAEQAPVSVEAPAGIYVWASQAMIIRVIENIVCNSLKHGSGTRVFLKEQGRKCVITVSNQCDPIGKRQLRRIFKPGAQLNKNSGGMGVGLDSVRGILRECGGSVRARAVSGGVEFAVTLPLCPHKKLPLASASSAADSAL